MKRWILVLLMCAACGVGEGGSCGPNEPCASGLRCCFPCPETANAAGGIGTCEKQCGGCG
jgi:hypothetical protein